MINGIQEELHELILSKETTHPVICKTVQLVSRHCCFLQCLNTHSFTVAAVLQGGGACHEKPSGTVPWTARSHRPRQAGCSSLLGLHTPTYLLFLPFYVVSFCSFIEFLRQFFFLNNMFAYKIFTPTRFHATRSIAACRLDMKGGSGAPCSSFQPLDSPSFGRALIVEMCKAFLRVKDSIQVHFRSLSHQKNYCLNNFFF